MIGAIASSNSLTAVTVMADASRKRLVSLLFLGFLLDIDMKYFYSPSTNGFYLSAVHAEIPDDAKEISEDLYKTLLQSGGQIESDADGMPMPAQHRAATVAELACASQAQVDAEYTRRMGELANNYPAHERESWPVQLAEAQALQADANAITPWIDQCAAARGLDRLQLALRILQKMPPTVRYLAS